ncbi:MAG: EAL domain-containing protein, partial [Anaerotignaceae bacterium]
CSHWELSPYKNAGLCGAFMMGEIANVQGRNEFLNGSCCLVGVAENDNYIRPDIQVFEELKAIGEDTTNLLNVVLKRQQEATSKQNEHLMETLIAQQKSQNEHMYIDFNTGMVNYLKYKEDVKSIRYDKLCVIKIENAELLITHLGHSAYQEIMRKILVRVEDIVNDLRNKEHALMKMYLFNESSFFVAADERMSESHFMRICKKMHETYHFFHTDEEEVVVCRLVVCLNQKDPIESALNTLVASKNTQNSFLVCQNDNEGTSSDEEFKMIGVLNRAFEKGGIVPYFQGIYSNKKKCISYYEALIRIKDIDGTVYAPGQFIEIAKKYHMYAAMSRNMLNKVFDLFCDIDVVVSMNISAFDIQSDATKQMIYQWLKSCDYPQNFVFEILEDEAYQDFTPLKEFIANIRELGARVAIDDFGAGYSNLYEISNISFDIIKVDGSIIRNLPSSECNRKLLDVITHMGILFDADIVAEFVENKAIQDIIEQT